MNGNLSGGTTSLLRIARTQCRAAVAFLALSIDDDMFATATYPVLSDDDVVAVSALDDAVQQVWDDPEWVPGSVLIRAVRSGNRRLAGAKRVDVALVRLDNGPDGRPRGILGVAAPEDGEFGRDIDGLAQLATRMSSYLRARQEIRQWVSRDPDSSAPVYLSDFAAADQTAGSAPAAVPPRPIPVETPAVEPLAPAPFVPEPQQAVPEPVQQAPVPVQQAPAPVQQAPVQPAQEPVVPRRPAQPEVAAALAAREPLIEASVPDTAIPSTFPDVQEEPIAIQTGPRTYSAPEAVSRIAAETRRFSEASPAARPSTADPLTELLQGNDPVTGLPPLSTLLSRTGRILGASYDTDSVLAVVVIEIAGLDSDASVRAAAQALRGQLRFDDPIARLGTATFAAVVPMVTGITSGDVVERTLAGAVEDAITASGAINEVQSAHIVAGLRQRHDADVLLRAAVEKLRAAQQ